MRQSVVKDKHFRIAERSSLVGGEAPAYCNVRTAEQISGIRMFEMGKNIDGGEDENTNCEQQES